MGDTRVIIVGAGAAGIAAATRLLECGVNNLLILEAQDRIGGRIYTYPFGNGVIELGAQWVHGEKGNVVFCMANPYGLLTETVTEIIDTNTVFVGSCGSFLTSKATTDILQILTKIDANSEKELQSFHGSLGEYFTKEFEAELRECMSPQYFNLARCLLNWYEKMENSVDGADSWCDTSGHGLTEYWECKGNLLWCWKCGGFQKIFDILMNKFPDPSCELPVMEKTLCGKEVSLITWNQDSTDKVSVRCSDDSLYLADHVIVTVSLGVLKERARCMFAPCLPECKDIAIEGLAMGTVNKIFLQFSCRWWPEDCQGFNFVWDEQDREELIKRSKGGPRDISWVMDVLGFYSVDGQPLCLVGWITGCYSRQLEQLSDCDFLEDVMMLLNKFLGKQYSIPQPQEFKRSCWYSNPYTRGSYSFRSMETERLRTSAFHLSRPLTNVCGEPIVMFAGEATHDHYYSTVHGAIETGWREADRLLKHFRTQHSSL